MPPERPRPPGPRAELRTNAPKKPALPESGPDRDLFDSLLAIVERKMADNHKHLGAPKDAEAKRRRIEEAVDLALNSKNLEGERSKLFLSLLKAELGKRGGKKTAERNAAVLPPPSADEELDLALREAHRERIMEGAREHERFHGPENRLDRTTLEDEE